MLKLQIIGEDVLADKFINIAVGFYHACALALSGRIRCWGPSLEVEFRIKNYTHHALLENDPSQIFDYPTVIPNVADVGTYLDMSSTGWNFHTPKEEAALDYKNLNFLPLTSKFGFTSTGSGDSGIPNTFV